jgi:hypothetical protein
MSRRNDDKQKETGAIAGENVIVAEIALLGNTKAMCAIGVS